MSVASELGRSPNIPTKPLLVVEDSDEDFEALSRILRKLAFSRPIYRVQDGDEALDFLYRQGSYTSPEVAPRPALVLLDLNLPGTDGREVVRQVKQDDRLCAIPIIVFSTSSSPRDIHTCYQYGANSYMLKPVGTAALTANLQELVRYWFDAAILPNEERR